MLLDFFDIESSIKHLDYSPFGHLSVIGTALKLLDGTGSMGGFVFFRSTTRTMKKPLPQYSWKVGSFSTSIIILSPLNTAVKFLLARIISIFNLDVCFFLFFPVKLWYQSLRKSKIHNNNNLYPMNMTTFCAVN